MQTHTMSSQPPPSPPVVMAVAQCQCQLFACIYSQHIGHMVFFVNQSKMKMLICVVPPPSGTHCH